LVQKRYGIPAEKNKKKMAAKGTKWNPSSISVLLFVPAFPLVLLACYSKFRVVLEGGLFVCLFPWASVASHGCTAA
jgi:hypothetical protein